MSAGRVRIGAAVTLLAPFVPMLFQGEEWAASSPFQYFTDHEDPELGRAVSKGRREEFASFGWDPESVPDPQAPETFERSRLDWGELHDPVHAEVLEWHRRLIGLRREYPELRDGRLEAVEVAFDEDDGWFRYKRGRIEALFNTGSAERKLSVAPESRLLAASEAAVRLEEASLVLPPDSVAVLARD